MRIIERTESMQSHSVRVPRHVAIIMDGNGRWATFRGRQRTAGHFAARRPILDCTEAAMDRGVSWLSFFAFSTENWIRPAAEVEVLLDFARWFFSPKTVRFLLARGVRLRFIGETNDGRIPLVVRNRFRRLEEETSGNDHLNLVIAFNYGGQTEIVNAVKKVLLAGLDPDGIDVSTLHGMMYLPEMPPVDLLIRTSGEQRLSNFMLWHVAYAELVFFDTLWPDFTKGHMESAIREFQGRQRRFGGVPDAAQLDEHHEPERRT